jgi:superfamily II DNA helicase RecQ
MDIESAINSASARMGITVKHIQRDVVREFVKGNDVFGILPMGYGKSLCYQLLPYVFDSLNGQDDLSCVIIITPLTAIKVNIT